MKFLIVLTIACAFAVPSDAFLLDTFTNAVNSITSSVTGAVGSISNTISNVIDTTSNVIDTVQFGAQFLWDNAFGPALELAVNNGAIWVDDYFGGVLNAIGKRNAAVDDFHTLYQIETDQLLDKLQVVYHQFLSATEKVLEASAFGLLGGSLNAADLVTGIVSKFEQLVDSMIENTIHTLMVPASAFGPISSEFIKELKAKIVKIGSVFKMQLSLLATSIIDKVDVNVSRVFKPKY